MPCVLDVELPSLKDAHKMFDAVLQYMYTGVTTFNANALLEFFATVHALRLDGPLVVRLVLDRENSHSLQLSCDMLLRSVIESRACNDAFLINALNFACTRKYVMSTETFAALQRAVAALPSQVGKRMQ